MPPPSEWSLLAERGYDDSGLHLVTLTGPTGALQQTTRITDAQRAILAATAVAAPPRITALQPA